MFHTGDLNSGISLAIQQSKLVACFIASPTALSDPEAAKQSIAWEDEWLPELQEIIDEKAVLLRLEYGSKEAGFLSAFCTITDAPTLVVIKNGQVVDQLEKGLSREEWVERLLKALGVDEGMEGEEEIQRAEAQQEAPAAATTVPVQAPAVAASPAPAQSTESSASTSRAPVDLFPDRAARLEADKQKREAAEKAARDARTAARKKEAEEAHAHHKGKQRATDTDDKVKARDQYLVQQKRRKDEAKAEKARILAQIEADKQERRNRAQRAKDAANGAAGESSPLPEGRLAEQRRSAGAGGMCQLQVRLFDGSSIRGRFSTNAKLGDEVRKWIREEAPEGSGGADIPFTFRQILAPQPSRSIEMGEENSTLADLDLLPSATLVLVPVAGSVDAYAAQNQSYLGYASSLLSSAYSGVSYFLPSFSRVYLGGTSDPQEAGNVEGAAMAGTDSQPAASEAGQGAAKVRVKTLADQRAEAAKRDKQAEFYNGNSLGTVPRKDEDGGGKED